MPKINLRPARKPAIILLIVGIFMLIFGFTVPPYIVGKLRTIPTNLDFTLVSTSPEGFTHTERIVSGKTPKIDEIAITSEQTYTNPAGQVFARYDDSVTLIGHSHFPALKPNASLTGTLPTGSEVNNHDEVRDGLRYFFPPNTQRQSYPYFDDVLGVAEPVDYVDRDDDTYIFHGYAPFQQLDDPKKWVDRTLWVDRYSGTILEKEETQIVRVDDEDIPTTFRFDPQTREAMHAAAQTRRTQLTTTKAVEFMAKFLGTIFVIAAVVKSGILRRPPRWLTQLGTADSNSATKPAPQPE